MNRTVSNKRLTIWEALSTYFTFEWSFTCVLHFVTFDFSLGTERLPTESEFKTKNGANQKIDNT